MSSIIRCFFSPLFLQISEERFYSFLNNDLISLLFVFEGEKVFLQILDVKKGQK